jgi:hypothetical protein
MSSTKRLKLSPLAQAIPKTNPSAPKKSHPQSKATTQEAVPALGALHLKPIIVNNRTPRGKKARNQFRTFNSSITKKLLLLSLHPAKRVTGQLEIIPQKDDINLPPMLKITASVGFDRAYR